MAVKHLKLDMDHNVIDRRVKTVTRVKSWVEPEWLTIQRRDDHLVTELKNGTISHEDRKYIIEKYNIRFDLFGKIV